MFQSKYLKINALYLAEKCSFLWGLYLIFFSYF